MENKKTGQGYSIAPGSLYITLLSIFKDHGIGKPGKDRNHEEGYGNGSIHYSLPKYC